MKWAMLSQMMRSPKPRIMINSILCSWNPKNKDKIFNFVLLLIFRIIYSLGTRKVMTSSDHEATGNFQLHFPFLNHDIDLSSIVKLRLQGAFKVPLQHRPAVVPKHSSALWTGWILDTRRGWHRWRQQSVLVLTGSPSHRHLPLSSENPFPPRPATVLKLLVLGICMDKCQIQSGRF